MKLQRLVQLALTCVMLTACGGEDADNFDLVITHGRVIDPESGLDGVRSVGIRDGKVASIVEGELNEDTGTAKVATRNRLALTELMRTRSVIPTG